MPRPAVDAIALHLPQAGGTAAPPGRGIRGPGGRLMFRRSCIAVLLAVLAALWIAQASATAKPKPPQPPPLPQEQIVPGTETDPINKRLIEHIRWYRETFRIAPGAN